MKLPRDECGVCKPRSQFCCFMQPVTRRSSRCWTLFPIVNASSAFHWFDADYDNVGEKKRPRSLYECPAGETGWQRVKLMFTTDELGRPGPEWSMIVQGTYGGILAGAVVGGFSGANSAKEKFLRTNQATKYHTELHGKRALQDKITLGMVGGGAKYGVKMGTFSFIFIFTTTLSSVYRGKTNVLDFVAAGTFSGILWRLTQGSKAMLVSGILGAALGLFAGSTSMLLLHFTDSSIEELRYWHYRSLTGDTWREVEHAKVLEKSQPSKETVNSLNSQVKEVEAKGTTNNIAAAVSVVDTDVKTVKKTRNKSLEN